MRRIELIDTSVLVELLRVPYEHDHVEAIEADFVAKKAAGKTGFYLPVAAVVETGQHVERIENGHHRRECARKFAAMLERTRRREAPWALSPLLWDEVLLAELLDPTVTPRPPRLDESLARRDLEMGDLLIVAEFRRIRANLRQDAVEVDVWTLDDQLRATVEHLRAGTQR